LTVDSTQYTAKELMAVLFVIFCIDLRKIYKKVALDQIFLPWGDKILRGLFENFLQSHNPLLTNRAKQV
jgi:hypothetical protein